MSGGNRPHPDDATAIVGVGLRLPGAESVDALWRLLAEERCVVGEVPPGRGGPQDAMSGFRGGFIEDADAFDASFFGIAPREATFMDPQQRFALELAWNAVEDAGYAAAALAGSNTGVFMGVANSDYTELVEGSSANSDPYVPTGMSSAMIANRVSHWFDLRGPSLTLDTACASSLTALHQAVRAIESEDCDQALVGAVNLCWTARRFSALTRNGMLAADGVCRAFDERADGYVRAEGGAVLLLKRLSRAQEDGDAIHAVVRGVRSNHGGRTNSLTITNPRAHTELIREVYARAGVDPRTVTYVETHGPGTPLGDPIEIHGLKAAFDGPSDRESPVDTAFCGLGSVKTNLGHLESAAGVAGILKVVAAMRHRILPASLHFERLNPLINLEGSPFYIVDRARDWQTPDDAVGVPVPRRAGVSSFGFGGSNAHVLLEEPPAAGAQAPAAEGTQRLVPLSARDAEQLTAVARRLLRHLADSPAGSDPEYVRDLGYTLQTGREAFPCRVAFLAADSADLTAQLESFAEGGEARVRCWTGRVADGEAGLAVLAGDEDAEAMVRSWLAKGKLAQVAELWTLGWEVDWRALYADEQPRRLHLPTYPFARRRYWVGDVAERPAEVPGRKAQLPAMTAPAAGGASAVDPGPLPGKPQGIRLRVLEAGSAQPAGPTAPVDQPEPLAEPEPRSRSADAEPLQRELAQTLADALYVPLDEVGVDAKFVDLGLDSVIATEWVRTVNSRFGTALSAAQVYDFPTVREFSARILADRPVPPDSAGPAPLPPVPGRHPAPVRLELVELLAEVLFLEPQEVSPDRKFVDLGVDSVIAVEWVRVLNERYGTALPTAVVYDHPTIDELADHVSAMAGPREAELDELLRQVSAGSVSVDEAELLLASYDGGRTGQ